METSDPEKVFFPESGITKGEIVDYYRRIADVMLPHVRGRCVSMHRWPDGIGGRDFYQKEAPDHFPTWIRTERVPRKSGGSVRHVVIDDARTLVYLADQACLTPHVWLSRAAEPARPDRIVFDLDPPDEGEDAASEVRWAARELRAVLGAVGLRPRVMTSGSKGLHVHVTVGDAPDFETTRAFARSVSERLARLHPDRLTTEQRKQKRGGRVFLDYLRNGYAQTSVPPYAVRARPGAPVATPLDWDELPGVHPRRYHVGNVFRRLGQREDPWAGADDETDDLAHASTRLAELDEADVGGNAPAGRPRTRTPEGP